MVRSMTNLTIMLLSFWDYALESATHILNMVWMWRRIVMRDTPEKLQQRSVKCIFHRIPKGNNSRRAMDLEEIQDARYVEFLEKNILSQEVSERARELEEIQDERSVRTHRAPKHLCLNVEVKEHSLGDLNEPANYKAAMLDQESNKWLDAMNAEMQSMKDNQVWRLVDLPPDGKTVGSKWLFKKKTDMDGNVHTYKARLVAKRFTQTYGVDYEETFSPVADIRAIRILIAL
ncbi:retrotransposon protein, putative, ty1-copia subclass [Tanacetum coccineum]